MTPLTCMGILCIIMIALYLYFNRIRVEPFDDYSVDSVGEAEPPKGKSAVIQASQGVDQDAGVCNKPGSPKDVCRNFGSCCEVADPTGNCFCTNPVIKDCRTIYKECLADKYFSQATMDFIDPGNKGKVCKRILDSCCNNLETDAPDDSLRVVTMHAAPFTAKKLCEITSTREQTCKRACSTNPKCMSAIYGKTAENCTLYDVPLVTKAGAYRNGTDTETVQFMRMTEKEAPIANSKNNKPIPAKEGFGASPSKEGFGSAYDYCLNNKTGGYWGVNNVVKECQTKKANCLKQSASPASCQSMYAACCSILDGLDMTERFRFLEPEAGVATTANKLYQGSDIPTLDACKTQCLLTPGCDYIYSNIGASNVAIGFCGLYKGTPGQGQSITFGKPNPSAKQIWRKEAIPEEPPTSTP